MKQKAVLNRLVELIKDDVTASSWFKYIGIGSYEEFEYSIQNRDYPFIFFSPFKIDKRESGLNDLVKYDYTILTRLGVMDSRKNVALMGKDDKPGILDLQNIVDEILSNNPMLCDTVTKTPLVEIMYADIETEFFTIRAKPAFECVNMFIRYRYIKDQQLYQNHLI